MRNRGLWKQYLMAIAVISIVTAGFGCQQNIVLKSGLDKRLQITQIYQKLARKFPEVKSITVEELQRLQQQRKPIVLVDVRSKKEREVSIIPGAISNKEFEANLEKYQNAMPMASSAIAIAYCTIGYRSGQYAKKLQDRDINILNLEGSLLAWSHIQGKLVNSKGETKKIHVFSRQWQLTADNYQPVW